MNAPDAAEMVLAVPAAGIRNPMVPVPTLAEAAVPASVWGVNAPLAVLADVAVPASTSTEKISVPLAAEVVGAVPATAQVVPPAGALVMSPFAACSPVTMASWNAARMVPHLGLLVKAQDRDSEPLDEFL